MPWLPCLVDIVTCISLVTACVYTFTILGISIIDYNLILDIGKGTGHKSITDYKVIRHTVQYIHDIVYIIATPYTCSLVPRQLFNVSCCNIEKLGIGHGDEANIHVQVICPNYLSSVSTKITKSRDLGIR